MFGRKGSRESISLGDELRQVNEDSLVIEEKGLVFSLCSDTLAMAISVDGVERGLIFLGRGDYALNSRIRVYDAVFSKLYAEDFEDWGMVIGDQESWPRLEGMLGPVDTLPEGYTEEAVVKEAGEKLDSLIGGWGHDLSEKIGWRFKVRTGKGTTSLVLKEGRLAFHSSDAQLAVADEETLALKEGELRLSVKGDKIAMKAGNRKVSVASSGEKMAVASPEGKIAATGWLLGEEGVDVLSMVSDALTVIGYESQ